MESINTKSGVNHSISSDESGEEIIEEGSDFEDTQVIQESLPNDKYTSNFASQSCFVDNPSEESEADDSTKDTSFLGNSSHLPSDDLPATTEDVLLCFYEAFRKTNHQLKRNDATLMELFKEQNEILRTQTVLMKKLAKQDLSKS